MRLTYKAQDQYGKETGTIWYASTDGDSIFPKSAKEEQVLKKLAAYEDAEEQGRMVILPCNVGDTFFFMSETIHGELYVAQSRVSDIVITGDALMIVDSDGCYHYTYWFSRAEAEAALKGEMEDV